MVCQNKKGGPGHDLNVLVLIPCTPHPTTNLDSWEWFLVGKAAERQVGEFGSTTHMADGEGHTRNKGVTNTSRCGEEAGEEARRGERWEKKETEVLVSFKEKDTLIAGLPLKRTIAAR